MMCSNVDLPEPLGPINVRNSCDTARKSPAQKAHCVLIGGRDGGLLAFAPCKTWLSFQ